MYIDLRYLTPSVHVHFSLLLIQVGDEKVFWFKAITQAFQRSNFIALLTVADGTMLGPVCHFARNEHVPQDSMR